MSQLSVPSAVHSPVGSTSSIEEHAQRPISYRDITWMESQATISTFAEVLTPRGQPDVVQKKVLLLGMVKAEEYRTNVMGQEGRDRTRIDAMEKQRWDAFTADNKHPQIQKRLERVKTKNSTKLVSLDTNLPQHCDTDFANKRFFTDLRTRFGPKIKFDTVILDYFFSPMGYVQERWLDEFFMKTLPKLVTEDMLDPGSCVWLPHIDYTAKKLEQFSYQIDQLYVVDNVEDPNMNPLFYATGLPETEARLLQFPEKLVNENQLNVLDKDSPFISLTSRGKTDVHVVKVPLFSNNAAGTSAAHHISSGGESSSSCKESSSSCGESSSSSGESSSSTSGAVKRAVKIEKMREEPKRKSRRLLQYSPDSNTRPDDLYSKPLF